MRVPLSWLREYVKVDLSVDDLSERLTLGGLEVGAIDRIGEAWDKETITVGQVVSVRQHPNADRLVLVTVDVKKGEPIEVVTGAPNLHVGDAGQKVVFAEVGARLIDAYAETKKYKTLKKSNIRGVPSTGMVCSEKELGISDEHTGIIILPDDAPVGMPFARYWGDVVYDLDLTPNLARCFSITGVARDTAALTDSPLTMPEPTVVAEGEPIDGKIEIEIADPDLCPRYSAALITGVEIKPSPQWMQRRLLLAGMRPINNIVDITNYVMLEWGQPLHAFDYQRLRPRTPGGPPTIIVRRATEGEQMVTLDNIERTFTTDNLLITDGGGPVGIAGVMGGLESEVEEDTTDILLEAANFHNINTRRTMNALKLPSEAAQRFGRGVDAELTLVALRRASELMRDLGGGTVAQGFVDVYPLPQEKKVIDLDVALVKRLLGIDLDAEAVAKMLTKLGFSCEILDGQSTVVRTDVPSFRLDVSIPEDLIEEVARMVGYDRLPTTLMNDELPAQRRNLALELEERVRDILVGCGLAETISYSLTNLESVSMLSPEPVMPDSEAYIRLTNTLTREHEYMRQTLMNTALETVSSNLRFVDRVAIFEIARVYLTREGQALPDEPTRLSIALSGRRETRSWLADRSEPMGFYDLKGIVETLCTSLGVANVTYEPTMHPTFHPGRVAAMHLVGADGEDVEVGVLGEVHPTVRGHYDLPDQCVCLLELDLDLLLAHAQPDAQFEPISRMPALKLDLAVVVDRGVSAAAIEDAIRETGGRILVDAVLFDVYKGEQVGAGKHSLAYSLTFQSPDKTLTTEQATKQRDRILNRLARDYGAEIRG